MYSMFDKLGGNYTKSTVCFAGATDKFIQLSTVITSRKHTQLHTVDLKG